MLSIGNNNKEICYKGFMLIISKESHKTFIRDQNKPGLQVYRLFIPHLHTVEN